MEIHHAIHTNDQIPRSGGTSGALPHERPRARMPARTGARGSGFTCCHACGGDHQGLIWQQGCLSGLSQIPPYVVRPGGLRRRALGCVRASCVRVRAECGKLSIYQMHFLW